MDPSMEYQHYGGIVKDLQFILTKSNCMQNFQSRKFLPSPRLDNKKPVKLDSLPLLPDSEDSSLKFKIFDMNIIQNPRCKWHTKCTLPMALWLQLQ